MIVKLCKTHNRLCVSWSSWHESRGLAHVLMVWCVVYYLGRRSFPVYSSGLFKYKTENEKDCSYFAFPVIQKFIHLNLTWNSVFDPYKSLFHSIFREFPLFNNERESYFTYCLRLFHLRFFFTFLIIFWLRERLVTTSLRFDAAAHV